MHIAKWIPCAPGATASSDDLADALGTPIKFKETFPWRCFPVIVGPPR